MKDLAGLFSKIAPVYDALNHLFSFGSDRTWRQIMVSTVWAGQRNTDDTLDVLDVCTGTGDVAVALAAGGARVTGIDVSEGMLTRAQAKLARRGLETRVTLRLADALALPYPESSYDVVTTAFGLRNLPDRLAAIREMVRVLEPGGRLVILEFAPPPSTLFGRVFRVYLERLMPRIGGALSGSQGAYRYLFTSIASFHGPQEIVAMMTASGLKRPRARSLMGGIVFLYSGEKPSADTII